ncbi:MAG TPA: hypothetical protein ENN66_05535 [Proteobacteria bacterium]|nr:hypothetical protein [Pseudomonadota bacterium]
MDDEPLIRKVIAQMSETGLFDSARVMGAEVYRMRDAYPVLEKRYEQRVGAISSWLKRFTNLHISGRNGTFTYIHIHDLMAQARQLAGRLSGSCSLGI